MTQPVSDRLYELLPAIYRTRDVEQEQSLRALFSILEHELLAIEADIEGLYDDWFVETCSEWVIPYIGDLVKVPGLHSGDVGSFSLRAYVANVLRYRSRKGTATVLEQVARDVSGWPSRVVEFNLRLSMTQHINHVRPMNVRTPDLRATNDLELLGGPFETANYSTDVRHVDSGRGKYNIPNMGIYLWRLQSYAMTRAEAMPLTMPSDSRYYFNPLGKDMPLFNRPQTETEITHLAEEFNVPGRLRRRPLYEELQARRQALLDQEIPQTVYFGKQPVLQVYLDGADQAIPPEQIMICDLTDWDATPSSAKPGIAVQVDPVLGRLAFPADVSPEQVQVSYAYGFSSDVGGGPYNRSESLAGLFTNSGDIWWAGVSESQTTDYTSIGQAVQAWNTLADTQPRIGVIAVLDSHSYIEDIPTIVLSPNSQLLIVAASWRSGSTPASGPLVGDLNRWLVAEEVRPHLKGNISIAGLQPNEDEEPGRLLINGLLIEGAMTVECGELDSLTLSHCTLVPDNGGLAIETLNSIGENCNTQLSIHIERSICGPLIVPQAVAQLRIIDSIVDAGMQTRDDSLMDTEPRVYAIAGDAFGVDYSPPTTIERCTIFGQVYVKELTLASEVIFNAKVIAKRLQAGCVRYSYVSLDSSVPRRFRCQPNLALAQHTRAPNLALGQCAEALESTSVEQLSSEEQQRIALSVTPLFTSRKYGEPAYAQLSVRGPLAIRNGAEDGAEMGVFNHLKQAQREANVRVSLQEYLRFGLEAGIFFVN